MGTEKNLASEIEKIEEDEGIETLEEPENTESTLAKATNSYDDFDFEKAKQLTNADYIETTRQGGGGKRILSLSVTNTSANGRRVVLSTLLHEALGSPTSVQILPDNGNLLMGEIIPNAAKKFAFSSGKGINVLYRDGIAEILTKKFNLDFSNRTTNTFHNITIHRQVYKGKDILFAVIDMTKPISA